MTRRHWTELAIWQLLGVASIYFQLTQEQFPFEKTLTLFLMAMIAFGYWWEARHRRMQLG